MVEIRLWGATRAPPDSPLTTQQSTRHPNTHAGNRAHTHTPVTSQGLKCLSLSLHDLEISASDELLHCPQLRTLAVSRTVRHGALSEPEGVLRISRATAASLEAGLVCVEAGEKVHPWGCLGLAVQFYLGGPLVSARLRTLAKTP